MIVLNDNYSAAEKWDGFVQNNAESRYCHLYHYGYATEIYGFQPKHFCFLKDEDVVGVLPAVYVRSSFFGRKLVSQPFSEYGGLLLAPTLTSDEIGEIIQLLTSFLAQYKIPCIEMHGCNAVAHEYCAKYFDLRNPHKHAYLELNQPVEQIWKSVVQYQVRKAVNKAQHSGMIVEQRCDEQIIAELFFPLYLQSMKRLGIPPHSVKYYIRCYRYFPDKMKIFWALRKGKAIAGLLGFTCGQRVNIVNTVSDPAYWQYRPNDLLHWEFVKWAHEEGYQYFDFGSVRYEGQLRYKEKWGCTIRDHGYYLLTAGGDRRRVVTFDSSSRLMSNFATIWSTCIPYRLGKTLGPIIRKHLVR
jgi:hypothetical protein